MLDPKTDRFLAVFGAGALDTETAGSCRTANLRLSTAFADPCIDGGCTTFFGVVCFMASFGGCGLCSAERVVLDFDDCCFFPAEGATLDDCFFDFVAFPPFLAFWTFCVDDEGFCEAILTVEGVFHG